MREYQISHEDKTKSFDNEKDAFAYWNRHPFASCEVRNRWDFFDTLTQKSTLGTVSVFLPQEREILQVAPEIPNFTLDKLIVSEFNSIVERFKLDGYHIHLVTLKDEHNGTATLTIECYLPSNRDNITLIDTNLIANNIQTFCYTITDVLDGDIPDSFHQFNMNTINARR